jgi:hypothetical protein
MLPRTIDKRDPDVASRVEVEILLCCARTRRDPQAAARILTLLQGDVDWDYLLQAAGRHGMVPLLFWHLDNACPETVPEAYMTELRRHFRSNSLKNLLLAGELLKLYELFEQNDIFAIPYKGPALAASVYRNLALRQAGDLDILVGRRDVLKAKELLLSLGYVPTPWRTGERLTPAQESAFLRFEREYAFMHEGADISVEIQWEVIPRYFSFSWDPVSLRQRRQLVSLGGGAVSTFVPEDLLLVLCIHGSKHFWERLRWVCDVGETVNLFREMDWDDIMARAAAFGSERMLLLGLSLAHSLLNADVPVALLEKARADPAVERLAEDARRRLFSESDDTVGNLDWSAFHPFHYRMRERWRDRLGYVLLKLAEPNAADWMERPLPERLFPLYFVLRPLRLIRKLGRRLVNRIKKKGSPTQDS